ncbi:hypothetical protein PARA125_001196 [Parachlamydia sp. AcF125]|nr:hypothetical protein [Parachlamydia sp. AcF125]
MAIQFNIANQNFPSSLAQAAQNPDFVLTTK